jgi:periplasmic protein TonB
MARAVVDRYPAMAASAALHAAVLILALISWPWSKTIRIGDVVTVNLVTSADLPAAAPAVQAPEPAPAAAETPVAQAPPQPPAPVQTPTPAPAPPVAKAAPTPAAHPTAAARPAPKAAPELDRAALLASLTRQEPVSGPRQSSAARGATRPDQAVQARTSSGASDAASGAALASLSGELQRLWNPICSAPGAADVTIKVTFRIGASGRLVGSPQSSQAGAADNVVQVASDRAVRPIYQADPFADPAYAVLYGQNITVNFDQKTFCSNR